MPFGYIGAEMLTSKAPYGSVISTVSPPVSSFPRVNVTLGFSDRRLLCVGSSSKYVPVSLLSLSPKAFSNSLHTEVGNQNSGIVESINAKTGADSNLVVPVTVFAAIERMLTVKSMELSAFMLNRTLFGTNRDAS